MAKAYFRRTSRRGVLHWVRFPTRRKKDKPVVKCAKRVIREAVLDTAEEYALAKFEDIPARPVEQRFVSNVVKGGITVGVTAMTGVPAPLARPVVGRIVENISNITYGNKIQKNDCEGEIVHVQTPIFRATS